MERQRWGRELAQEYFITASTVTEPLSPCSESEQEGGVGEVPQGLQILAPQKEKARLKKYILISLLSSELSSFPVSFMNKIIVMKNSFIKLSYSTFQNAACKGFQAGRSVLNPLDNLSKRGWTRFGRSPECMRLWIAVLHKGRTQIGSLLLNTWNRLWELSAITSNWSKRRYEKNSSKHQYQ